MLASRCPESYSEDGEDSDDRIDDGSDYENDGVSNYQHLFHPSAHLTVYQKPNHSLKTFALEIGNTTPSREEDE